MSQQIYELSGYRDCSPKTCVEVITPFLDSLGNAPDVQIMGGIGSTALGDPRLTVDFDAKELRVPDLLLPIHRDNGQKRDVDIFISNSNPERLYEVNSLAQAAIGTQLDSAVCNVRSYDEYQRQHASDAQPLGNAFRFLSERYEADATASTYVKSLSPFATPIDASTLEQWSLIIDDSVRIPVSHPGATLANYTQRSISGMRPKDKVKMDAAADRLFKLSPETREWLLDGPGRSQLDLSVALLSLRHARQRSVQVIDGIYLPTYSTDELIDGSLFMSPESPRSLRKAAVQFAIAKAHAVYWVESNKTLVHLLNNGVSERLLRTISGNT